MKRSLLVGICTTVIIVVVAVIAIIASNSVQTSTDNGSLFLTSYHTSCSDKIKNSSLGVFQNAAISSDAAPCAQIAKDILSRNGTAADAAVAAMFCVGVKNSQSSGLGGGFIAIYYSKKDNQMYTLDAREVAPMLAYKDMYNPDLNHSAYTSIRLQQYFQSNDMEFNIKANKNRWWEQYSSANIKGGLSVAVPGESTGLYELYSKFGSNIPWRELIEPTIKICEEGFNLTWYTGGITQMMGDSILVEPSMSIFTNKEGNRVLRQDDTVYRKQLALTLRKLQDDPRALNEGPLASKLVEDILSFGGLILENDLKNYKPLWREPVKVFLKNGNFTLYSFPPPGSGAIVGLILNILDEFLLDENSLSDGQIQRTQQIFAETMKFAFARRYQLGDLSVQDAKTVMSELSSDQLASDIKNKINEMKTSQDPLFYDAKLSEFDDAGTAHLSIIAPNGDAIGITSSINYGYGAGVRSEQTGIILNNQMADFNTPESINTQDVIWMENNLIRPGKRPLSSMSPTIILDSAGNVRLIIGGAGGTQIPTSIAVIAARNLWMKQDIKQAIDACRSHHTLQPMLLQYENGFPKELIDSLESKGHVTKKLTFKSTVQAVARTTSGLLEANADYRKSGQIDGF